ncbi:MocR-like pyridoxine biosynthesis transcription factor PdxR [Thalassobellus citreus]|uniref:MocR-like pyridoxine biosynthesis transcription factor PdxR n=1 Tax=Thalassobellus citreus TaxID=3367752 RepID=UPI003799BC4F
MIPYKTIITINRKSKQPLFIQLTNQFIALIKQGTLAPKTKLPSSRLLSELIGLHRKTIVACYEELTLQGWIKTVPKKGTFVNANLPLLQQQPLGKLETVEEKNKAGFSFEKHTILNRTFPEFSEDSFMYANDGVSDARLAPVDEIAVLYRRWAGKKSIVNHLSYGTTYGNSQLRNTLVSYLNETRGLHITKDNIIITRGSQMGMFLASQLLISNNEYVIIGETNYSASDTTFQFAGAKLLRVTVDKDGIDTKAIELLCKKHNIKAIYTTPHHHHPTTATLSAERRLHLLNLAKTYQFAIIEDDYDYDFHYNHAPILPLASHDKNSNVIYVGSVCKAVAPVFRVGYLIASKEFVDECAKLRRFIDRQGDALLELAFSSFIKDGSLDRHIKKVVKIYKARRDLFCSLLKTELSNYFSFEIPKGGMAIWLTLDKKYSWETVTKIALQEKLIIPDWKRYDMANSKHNSIRIGFATYNDTEIHEFIKRLKATMEIVENNLLNL